MPTIQEFIEQGQTKGWLSPDGDWVFADEYHGGAPGGYGLHDRGYVRFYVWGRTGPCEDESPTYGEMGIELRRDSATRKQFVELVEAVRLIEPTDLFIQHKQRNHRHQSHKTDRFKLFRKALGVLVTA